MKQILLKKYEKDILNANCDDEIDRIAYGLKLVKIKIDQDFGL